MAHISFDIFRKNKHIENEYYCFYWLLCALSHKTHFILRIKFQLIRQF